MKINEAVFEKFPILRTNRLLLREIRLADAPEIYEMRRNGRVNEFIARKTMPGLKDAELLAEKTINAFKNKQAIGFAGILRENNKIIGTCGFNSIDFMNLSAEIGGELSVDYWGKNIAIEAVETIVNFGFDKMKLHRIEAKLSPENRGAIFLLESLGFIKEGHFKDYIYFDGRFLDLAVYSKIA